MSDITVFWTIAGGSSLDADSPFDLGALDAPGANTEYEFNLYYQSESSVPLLTGCGFLVEPYTGIYPMPNDSWATADYLELRQFGDITVGEDPTGLLINMDKENSYPEASWVELNSGAGFGSSLILASTAVALDGGGYHTVNGELPLGSLVYFKLKVNAPAGLFRVGNRYFDLIFDYTV